MSANEITCFCTVLPLLLVGIARKTGDCEKKDQTISVQHDIILPLLRYANAIQRLCRHLENENSSPFFTASDLTVRTRLLQEAEQVAFGESLGKFLARDREDVTDIPKNVPYTIKAHMESHHRLLDIRMRGNVQNDSAMLGEKSLGNDNRVQARTQRGSDRDPNKTAEQTATQRSIRAPGILERMYPISASLGNEKWRGRRKRTRVCRCRF